MAFFYDEPSHTFSEYLLVPRLSGIEHIPQAVSLKTPLTKYKKGKEPKSLCVVCGLSNAAYQREDGVFVVPLTALGV